MGRTSFLPFLALHQCVSKAWRRRSARGQEGSANASVTLNIQSPKLCLMLPITLFSPYDLRDLHTENFILMGIHVINDPERRKFKDLLSLHKRRGCNRKSLISAQR